jgi:hypothetical protein
MQPGQPHAEPDFAPLNVSYWLREALKSLLATFVRDSIQPTLSRLHSPILATLQTAMINRVGGIFAVYHNLQMSDAGQN